MADRMGGGKGEKRERKVGEREGGRGEWRRAEGKHTTSQ